ncbi:MAG: hypothetical protein VB878_07795 [Pirellulaceae bacterium]
MRTLFCVLLLVALGCSQLSAREPTYRVLDSSYAAPRYDVRQRSPYVYGWFGSGNQTHWSHHFGYHRNYTQWSRW